MLISAAVFMVEDIAKHDIGILYELFGIVNYTPIDPDIAGEAVGVINRYDIIEILSIARQAGLL
jgi:hypothetical protein